MLPSVAFSRIGKGSLASMFDRLKELGPNFLFRDVASHFAYSLHFPILAVAEPPNATRDEG